MGLPPNLNDAQDEHVRSLISEGVAEGVHLDFKRELPRLDAAGRHELLADVSAFANASGGDLVYGVDEDGEGKATEVVPIAGNSDEEARRLLDSIFNGIEPRIPGVQIKTVSAAGGFVLIVRVPQSWTGPHRVKSNQHFFVREGGRKRQLDMPEIRGLFLRSDAQAQRVRDFRTERIGNFIAGRSPVRLVPGGLEVLHLVPTQSALGLVSVDPVQYVRNRTLPVIGSTVPNARINIDGALGVRPVSELGTHGYSLLFRNGFFETTKILTGRTKHRGRINLPSLAYEQELIVLLQRFRAELRHLGLGEEMTAMLTLVGAGDMELGLDPNKFDVYDNEGQFDREVLVIPDVLLPADQSEAVALKPLFDLVWHAAGMERSFNYNTAGEWVG